MSEKSSEICARPEDLIKLIFACSGGVDVGHLSDAAARKMMADGCGKMFCLAGIGGHLGGFVQSAKDVPAMVAIDGCEVGCAKAILDHAEIPTKNYLVLTELGIEKNKDFNLKAEDIQKVKAAVRSVCE